jgi:hypothetical protein
MSTVRINYVVFTWCRKDNQHGLRCGRTAITLAPNSTEPAWVSICSCPCHYEDQREADVYPPGYPGLFRHVGFDWLAMEGELLRRRFGRPRESG